MENIWEWAEQFNSVRYWLKELVNRSDGTRRVYVYNLKLFCDYIDKTPDELIIQRDSDLRAKDRRDKYRIETDVKSYMAMLDRKGASFGSRNVKYAAIRSFFDLNYRRLDGLKRSDAPTGENIGKRIPEKSEVKTAMNVAKCLRDRALICFAKDCGWRLGDIARLTWGDFKDLGDGFWHFKKITQKRKVKAFGFIGSETTGLLTLYRSQRERGTLRGKRGIPPESITPDSPLFVRQDKGSKPLLAKRMVHIISKVFSDAGFNDLSGHSLRKFFETALEDPKLHIRTNWIKRFTGKKISASMEPYVEQRVKKLLEAYKSAYSNLSLEEKPIDEDQRRKQALIDNVKMLVASGAYSPEKGKRIISLIPRSTKTLSYLSTDAIIKKIAESESEKKSDDNNDNNDNNDCTNGHCPSTFKEIAESELLNYLQNGWKIEYKTENGKLIIRKG